MTNSTLDVSVVICTYTEERWSDLVAAVKSIQRQRIPPREIIVVVDHNQHLKERVQTVLSEVIVVENSEPRGLSGSRNCGIARAQGAFIAFLDDDAVAEPDWLLLLYGCCEDPRVLGVGGTVEPLWSGPQPGWFPKEFYWVVGCTYQIPPELPVVVRNPYGGCTCIRREVFEVVGGFRSGIGRVGTRPLGGEETELCIRAKQYWPQKIFLYQPQAKIYHRIPSNRVSWHYFRSRCYAEGLSKAIISKYVGAKDSLSSERAYTFQTLPLGVLRSLASVLFRGDLAGLLRAGAILAGLLITIAGYLRGCMVQCTWSQKDAYDVKKPELQQSGQMKKNSAEQVASY